MKTSIATLSTLAYVQQLNHLPLQPTVAASAQPDTMRLNDDQKKKPHICVRLINDCKSRFEHLLAIGQWDVFDYLTLAVVLGALAKWREVSLRRFLEKQCNMPQQSSLTYYVEGVINTFMPNTKGTALFPLITILVYKRACQPYAPWMNTTAFWGLLCMPALRKLTNSSETGIAPLLILMTRQLLFLDAPTRRNKRRLAYMIIFFLRALLTRNKQSLAAHLAVLLPAFQFYLRSRRSP